MYLAPEVVNNLAYNEKVDIYSFGVILRLLLTGVAAAPQQVEVEEGDEDTVTDNGGSPNHSGKSVIKPVCAVVSTPMQLFIGTTS